MVHTGSEATPHDQVVATLAHYGFGLTNRKEWNGPLLSPEELFVAIVQYERDPRMLAGQAVTLRQGFNQNALYQKILEQDCVNRAGYLLEKIKRVWTEEGASIEAYSSIEKLLPRLDAAKDNIERVASSIPTVDDSKRLTWLKERSSDQDTLKWKVYSSINDDDLKKYCRAFR